MYLLTQFGLMWFGEIGFHISKVSFSIGIADRYCAVKSMIGDPPSPATLQYIKPNIVDKWTLTLTNGKGSAEINNTNNSFGK